MPSLDTRYLSLMIFPQKWSGNEIIANLLLLPNGDPTKAVGSDSAFSQTQPVLRAVFLPGLDKPCWGPTIDEGSLIYAPLYYLKPPSTLKQPGLLEPTFRSQIFSDLTQQFKPSVPARAASKGEVKKSLPQSYLDKAGFSTRDSARFSSDEEYGCDLRSTQPNKVPLKGKQTMAWGEVFSYALRHPLVAKAIGMSYLDVHIPLDSTKMVDGGWLWVEIDTTNPANWYSKLVYSSRQTLPPYQQPVRSYAARIPPLNDSQNLFAAVLFPTRPTTPKSGSKVPDMAQYEADEYVEGFAQIVHAYQPDSADASVGTDSTMVPGTDAGFQIGWDDEQVTVWLQRQVKTAQDMAQDAGNADEFPLGVQGYRVDVRKVADGSADPTSPKPAWISLVKVKAKVTAGTFSANATEELGVEPMPVSNADSPNFWLPRYFAHWRGRSLVVNDPYAYAFSGGQTPKSYAQSPTAPQFSGNIKEELDIDLRYGQWYQFRTRLSDLTGGGPTVDDIVSDAGVATAQFLRYVPPKATKVDPDKQNSPSTIVVNRPLLNYPEMVFAGAANEANLKNLLTKLRAKQAANQSMQVSVPDPDVVTLEVIVEAQAPSHDTGNPASMQDMSSAPQPGDLDGTFRVVYRHRVPWQKSENTIRLIIDPVQCSQISSIQKPSSGDTKLRVPTGRNLRIRIRGLGNAETTGQKAYWGSTVASTGLITDIHARYEAQSETNVLLHQKLQGFYLRTNPSASMLTPIENLAKALNLQVSGQTLTCPPGRRVLFGAQNTLRHSTTQDLSSITFSSLNDLIGHWIVAIRVTLDRDWTYSGVVPNGFVFSSDNVEVGRITLPAVVSALAAQATVIPTQSEAPSQPQRDQTDMLFFATVDSTVAPGNFPDVINTTWSISAIFTGSPTKSVNLWAETLNLPVTLNPQQTPKLVSAGVAESPYVADARYASTEQRQRALWLEFDGPPVDPNDGYYYRVLGYGPDPLLMSQPHDLCQNPEPPLAIDPEWIRVIVPGDTNDDAGLSAMTKLIPATAPLKSGKPVHFLVPLPNSLSPSALELFGFWTIELRVGHTLWSTAQTRYGRQLRVSGVQFPPPPLVLNVDRQASPVPSILAVSTLAQTVYNGVSLTDPTKIQTEIWFLLYAQVQRVDGQAWRNILLQKVRGAPTQSQGAQIQVSASFQQSSVDSWLKQWQLPNTTPTSVLAVELFNGETNVISSPKPLVRVGPTPVAVVVDEDPLGSQLGARRILRVSPLTAVSDTCPT
jgi:hypothetical protein